MQATEQHPDFTGRMLTAINTMLLDMLAAVARKDYEDWRRRQAQGIEKAKAEGAYRGRKTDEDLHKRIRLLLDRRSSVVTGNERPRGDVGKPESKRLAWGGIRLRRHSSHARINRGLRQIVNN